MVAFLLQKIVRAAARLRGICTFGAARYNPERHYMRGPGPALRRKLEA